MRLMRMRIVIARGLYRRWGLLLFLFLACLSVLLIYYQDSQDAPQYDVTSSRPLPDMRTPGDIAFLAKKYMRTRASETVPHRGQFNNRGNSHMNVTITLPGGRMGNILFAYASLLGIANMSNKHPVLPRDTNLNEYFEITVPELNQSTDSWKPFTEDLPCAYDSRVEDLEQTKNINLHGFFQSWKYFRTVESQLRKQLTFRRPIRRMAINFLRTSIREKFGANITRSDVVLVGIHVRQTDMTEYSNRLRGYKPADVDYIQAAMSYFEAIYRSLLFVVCSDNIFWSRVNVRSRVGTPIVFSEGKHAVVDLAILSLCDHTIITVGTFGWWAGWLAGGTTIFYSDYPDKHSLLHKQFVANDYFYPGWIGLPYPRGRLQ